MSIKEEFTDYPSFPAQLNSLSLVQLLLLQTPICKYFHLKKCNADFVFLSGSSFLDGHFLNTDKLGGIHLGKSESNKLPSVFVVEQLKAQTFEHRTEDKFLICIRYSTIHDDIAFSSIELTYGEHIPVFIIIVRSWEFWAY